MNQCDAVVINGEGTFIFRRPLSRDALFLLFIIEFATSRNKPVYLLNCMFSESPISGPTKVIEDLVGSTIAKCAAVVCRDSQSANFARRHVSHDQVGTLPDALFTWRDRISNAISLVRDNPDIALPYGSDNYVGRISLVEPYICVAGSSLLMRNPLRPYIMMIRKLQTLRIPVIGLQTCIGDSFMKEVCEVCEIPFVSQDVPILSAAGLVAGAACFVTGRFHPAIMASCGGTPCVFMGSNSHKNQTLQKVLRYRSISSYSSVPSNEEIEGIHADATEIMRRGSSLREDILLTAGQRDLEARRAPDALTSLPASISACLD
jgi:polysaccharide pyruvyl transferase WcaK-like protein